MAASNCGRAASGISPRSRNCPTTGRIRWCTTSSARINNGSAISRRTCSSTSWRNGSLTRSPQACPSAIDNSSSGTQASSTIASTRRCSNCRVSSARRVPRQSWYSGPPRTSEKSAGAVPACSFASRLHAAALDGLHQLGVVALGLVAIAFREISERAVERVAVAAIAGDARRVARRARARATAAPHRGTPRS